MRALPQQGPPKLGAAAVLTRFLVTDLLETVPRAVQGRPPFAQPRGLGCCVDLVIDQRERGVQVVLEGEPLARTLRALRLDEAAQSVDGISSMPLDAALETLVEVLPQLFRASKP